MKSKSEELIEYLLEIQAVKLAPDNPFTWASGMRSPIYCDNRITLSYPKVRAHIKSMFGALCSEFDKPDYIAGVATAGIAHGALLADFMDLPFVYVRSKAKAHGRQNQIEGRIESGKSVILVEDLVSTGMSSIAAAQALINEGIEIKAVIAIFNYGFDVAFSNFEDAGLPLKTLTNYSELIKKAKESNYITHEESTVLLEWNKDPQNWFDNNFK